jgi:hypothetical protein
MVKGHLPCSPATAAQSLGSQVREDSHQNSLSLSYCEFFLILYQSQSAEFREIVVSEKQNLS